MRLVLISFLVLLSIRSSKAQINLVPNPSFEDTVYCPSGTNQIDASAQWLNFGNSPDYFNACTGVANLGLPINYELGFQYAHSGNAMAGELAYLNPISGQPNYREFIGIHLSSNLIPGIRYYFSMFINFAGTKNIAIASNNFGINFSTVPYDSCCLPALLNTATFFHDSILTDSINWFKIESTFIADSSYSFITIGNFFDDLHTDTLNLSPFPYYSYYYIDDVCVTTDSLYNETWTSINELTNTNVVDIWPNPTSKYLNIHSKNKIKAIKIYNLIGELIQNNSINDFSKVLDISILNVGVFFVYVDFGNNNYVSKIIVSKE